MCTAVRTAIHPACQSMYVYYSTQVGMAAGSGFKARDLFAKVDMPGSYSSAVPFNAMLEATSILMLKLTPL
jgi:hypothetical protein